MAREKLTQLEYSKLFNNHQKWLKNDPEGDRFYLENRSYTHRLSTATRGNWTFSYFKNSYFAPYKHTKNWNIDFSNSTFINSDLKMILHEESKFNSVNFTNGEFDLSLYSSQINDLYLNTSGKIKIELHDSTSNSLDILYSNKEEGKIDLFNSSLSNLNLELSSSFSISLRFESILSNSRINGEGTLYLISFKETDIYKNIFFDNIELESSNPIFEDCIFNNVTFKHEKIAPFEPIFKNCIFKNSPISSKILKSAKIIGTKQIL